MNQHVETVGGNGVSIETYIDGDGASDIVVLPSYGRGVEDFDDFASALAEAGHRVLRPQPRGIGASTGPMTGVTIDQLGDDVARVIDQLGRGPAVVLGHAYGSFVARAAATNTPDKVRAVILAAASTQAPPRQINEAPFRAGDPDLPEADRLAALELAFFAPGHDARGWLSGWYPRTLAMQRSAVAGIDASRYWSAGSAPILEILAELDPFHPKDQWNDLREQLGARVTSVVVPDASHALFPEQGAAVARIVDEYMAGIRSGQVAPTTEAQVR
ncbi:alpha/beta fold hydrolase [Leifsonia sp. AG29]|uniref:alpha/beta fold hydrolase n=1 Tax=Leifsonia sp. AG29 TaxID=2598860 RepID=UPI00131DC1FE|nr:alpha/beta hydrolase [Leifsonia sp. AG29]